MKGNNFQLILLVVFIAAALFGVLVFAGLIKIGGTSKTVVTGKVVLWGTVKLSAIAPALDDFSRVNQNLQVTYIEKNPDTFDQDLLEALAAGTGPDMFILPDNLIVHYQNKIMPIPYTSIPQASFLSSYSSGGEVYLSSKGILALPLAIDPLVMYYNRNIFDAENIVTPPVYWDDLQKLVPILTKKDADGRVTRSAVALGQFSNITHAKDIISMLFMQSGNPIVKESGGFYTSTLAGNNAPGAAPLGPVLGFYASFANPLDAAYSWNRSLQNSQDAFSAEKVAIYFGYSSELPLLSNKNPNENFYIAPVPQVKNSKFKMTFGHTYGIAVSAYTKSPTVAFTVAGLLATGDFAQKFADSLLIAPARRDLLSVKPTDSYFPVFYSSALYARSWLDPSPKDTDIIFQNMVENVLSNNLSTENAVGDASGKLEFLLTK